MRTTKSKPKATKQEPAYSISSKCRRKIELEYKDELPTQFLSTLDEEPSPELLAGISMGFRLSQRIVHWIYIQPTPRTRRLRFAGLIHAMRLDEAIGGECVAKTAKREGMNRKSLHKIISQARAIVKEPRSFASFTTPSN